MKAVYLVAQGSCKSGEGAAIIKRMGKFGMCSSYFSRYYDVASLVGHGNREVKIITGIDNQFIVIGFEVRR
jgi:hypothetical protein